MKDTGLIFQGAQPRVARLKEDIEYQLRNPATGVSIFGNIQGQPKTATRGLLRYYFAEVLAEIADEEHLQCRGRTCLYKACIVYTYRLQHQAPCANEDEVAGWYLVAPGKTVGPIYQTSQTGCSAGSGDTTVTLSL